MNHTVTSSDPSWLIRHEFLLRRLHSLSGLIPVGAYMVVHFLTNASVLDSAATFQENVYRIHGLGRALVFVEWAFIFLPLIFHAVFGVIIIRGGLPNNSSYHYVGNVRYTLQRVTGVVAFLFIFWHVFQLHGWFHGDTWLRTVAEPLGGAKFRPYNAASSLALAIQSRPVVITAYVVGVLACVFHLANGIWTMGITWGVWTSDAAQRRANWVCLAFGLGLSVVGLSALTGVTTLDPNDAVSREDQMYKSKVAAQQINPERAEHKRWSEEEREAYFSSVEGEPAVDGQDRGETAETAAIRIRDAQTDP